jgi:GT2 family glycosyltransferase
MKENKKIQSKVSVVIPTYKGKSLMEKNFPSVLKSLRSGDEVVIVDDGGFKETLEWLKQNFKLKQSKKNNDYTLYKNEFSQGKKKISITYVVNHTTLRFAANSNRGVELASHPLIFLVNDDVSLYPDTIKKLVPHFSNKQVFAVGCLEFDHEHGGVKSGKNKLWFERGMFVHSKAADFKRGKTAWASGGSGMFDRQKWLQVGGLDLAYYPAYWEDIDLSATARERGWQVLFEPDARVDHNHETTNTDVFGQNKIRKISWRNANVFTWKHSDVWQKIAYLLWKPYWLIARLRAKIKA